MKSRAYQTVGCPQLEYAAEVWNLYIFTADHPAHIQHEAFVHHDYRRTTSVNNLLNILDWDHLNTRRQVSQLSMFYEIHHRHVNIHISQLISPATFTGKHDHQLKYAIQVTTTYTYKFSLYPLSKRLESATIYSSFCSFTFSIPSSCFTSR